MIPFYGLDIFAIDFMRAHTLNREANSMDGWLSGRTEL